MKISILALYEFDNTIFDGFTLFDGPSRETAINDILLNTADISAVYPDVPLLKMKIKSWHDSNLDNWKRLWAGLTAEYNPIWNVDGVVIETGTDTRTPNLKETLSGSDTITTIETPETVSTDSVMGMNSNTWAEQAKTEDTGRTTSTTTSSPGTVRTNSGTDETGYEHKTIRQGNIGVTKSTELVRDEILLRTEFNFYQILTESFIENFCIMVY